MKVEHDKVGSTPGHLRVGRHPPSVMDVQREVRASDGAKVVEGRLVPPVQAVIVPGGLVQKLEADNLWLRCEVRGEEAQGEGSGPEICGSVEQIGLALGHTRMGCPSATAHTCDQDNSQ